jgi:alkylhydroperoxidase family enzyme
MKLMDVGVTPLDLAEMPDDLREQLSPRVRRLGYLGDFFRYCGHQPDALLHFDQFTEALKKALPAGLTETVALTIATAAGNEYERAQHERLASRLGFSDAWIASLTGAEPRPAGLSDEQLDARALALAMLGRDWGGAQSCLASLAARVGEQQAIGVLMLAGRYLAHAAISNTLHLAIPSAIQAPQADGPVPPSLASA